MSDISTFEADIGPEHTPYLSLGAALAGSAGLTLPDPGIARTLGLARARVRLEAGSGPASAVFSVRATRSGGEAGYLGIEGEAILAEVETAEARIGHTLGNHGFMLGIGLIDSAWVGRSEQDWGLRSVTGNLGEEIGWLDRSDMGAHLDWTTPNRLLSTRLELTTGEGARWAERNESKDAGIILVLRPPNSSLDLSFYGRYGTQGIAEARDHRIGFRIHSTTPHFSASAEILQAWGLDADASRTPSAASAWATAQPIGPLRTAARLDLVDESLTTPDDHQLESTLLAGVGGPEWSLLLGWQHTHLGPSATPIAGSSSAQNSNQILLNLDVSIGFSR